VSIQNRQKLIEKIEKLRNSKVLVYFVTDRPIIKAQIASDAIRWIYDHLQAMNKNQKVGKIDLYLYSKGGSLETPWPIISVLREYCTTLNVLIPFKAFSATTLIAIGGDKIFMSRKGELGPIDPQMIEQQQGKGPPGTGPTQKVMSTEDVSSYISFIKDKVGITDQNALAALTKSLADTLTPTTLGQVNRVYSHIRTVARKMLSLVRPVMSTSKIQAVIESLTEKTYIHGHSIGREEAKQMGLQVVDMDNELEKLCWDLYLDYEKEMKIDSFPHPLAYFDSDEQDEYEEKNAVIACIESMGKCHEFSGPLKLKKARQVPPQMNFNLTIPVQLPPGIVATQVPQEIQRMLQQFQQQIATQTSSMISNQIKKQMPLIGIDLQIEKMKWNQVK